MNTKTVKEKVLCKHCSDTGKVWSNIGNFVPCDTENYCALEASKMPPTILDDDIADWEHDNLVEEDDLESK